MALCAMSLNISLIYPFAALSLGAGAFSQLVMFDMGHAIMVWTVTTVVACRYGGHADDIPVLLKRTLAAPALVGAVRRARAECRWRADPTGFPAIVLLVGQALVLLVPLAMGLLVSARGLRRPEVTERRGAAFRRRCAVAGSCWPGCLAWRGRRRPSR